MGYKFMLVLTDLDLIKRFFADEEKFTRKYKVMSFPTGLFFLHG
jgi:hypothetical protein